MSQVWDQRQKARTLGQRIRERGHLDLGRPSERDEQDVRKDQEPGKMFVSSGQFRRIYSRDPAICSRGPSISSRSQIAKTFRYNSFTIHLEKCLRENNLIYPVEENGDREINNRTKNEYMPAPKIRIYQISHAISS